MRTRPRLSPFASISLVLVLGPLASCGRCPVDDTPTEAQLAEHRQAVEAWRADREERLRDPEGWLSLAGLYWLEPGEHTVGSGEGVDIELPASAPERAGVLRVEEAAGRQQAYWVPAEDEKAQPLTADTDGEATRVEVGSALFYVIDRDGELGVRIKDLEHPAVAAFDGVVSFPVSWTWRKRALYVPYEPAKPFPVPTVLGTTLDEKAPGYVEFEHQGESYRIDALDAGDGEIWLIFGDATNGETTYGGGRFLYSDLEHGDPAEAGTAIVDFNRAYNPPCAFTPYATCPLPPPENKLDLAIEAGEKDFGHH